MRGRKSTERILVASLWLFLLLPVPSNSPQPGVQHCTVQLPTTLSPTKSNVSPAKDSMQILKCKFCSIQIFYWKEGRELSGPELFKWLSYEEVNGPAHIKHEVSLPCFEANKSCARWKLWGWKCLWKLNGPGLSLGGIALCDMSETSSPHVPR